MEHYTVNYYRKIIFELHVLSCTLADCGWVAFLSFVEETTSTGAGHREISVIFCYF